MIIQTERLILIPLSVHQLELWVHDLQKLEQELRCTYDAGPLEGEFKDTVKGQLTIAQKDSRNYLFYSFWLILRKNDRVVIGSADFKGTPNENGEVEIAYDIGEKYLHHGYLAESIESLCYWAKKQPRVRSILVETERNNLASQKILSQCGFYKEKIEDSIWWRLA